MISNYIRKAIWGWIGLCVIVWSAADLGRFESYSNDVGRIATLGLLVGPALLAIALLIVRRREQAGAWNRFSEYYRRIQNGETVEIRGESGLIRLLLGVGFFAWLIAATDSIQYYPIRLGLVIAAIAAGALLEALTIVPLLRQPILRISRDALESPVFGKLYWNDIDGIDLSEAEMRGIYFQHRLHLLILRLPSLVSQMHPATRLKLRMLSLLWANRQLRLRLKRTSEMPKVIVTLCQRLSSEYTANPRIWRAGMPAQQLVEQRRVALARREHEREKITAEVEGRAGPVTVDRTRRATKPESRSQLEIEAKLNAQADTKDLLEALRSIRKENAKRRDELWKMSVSPPPVPTHWTTWVAAAIAAVGMFWLAYLLYSVGRSTI